MAYQCFKDGIDECHDIVKNRVQFEHENIGDPDAMEANFRQALRKVCELSVSKACSAVELYKD